MLSHDLISSLPADILTRVRGLPCFKISVGHSPATVLRFDLPDAGALFLKSAPFSADPDPGHSLAAEADRLRWLGELLTVPAVIAFSRDKSREYLLTSAIEGADASAVSNPAQAAANIPALVEGLKRFHSIPAAQCPFNQSLDRKLEAACRRLEHGLVDVTDFDDERQGRTAADLYRELLATRPADEDLVVCHGDYCLPNIMLRGSELCGFIDAGRCGVADRYQDLALLSRSLSCALNPSYGPSTVPEVFRLYGIQSIDYDKIRFYQLLDEFF